MRASLLLRAATPRTPLIKFLGKRSIPRHNIPEETPANEPHPHPESPSHSLPDSFINYRSKAQQHGPLAGHNKPKPAPSQAPATSSHAYGAIGGHSGHELGSVKPAKGEVWDRSELPARFGRMRWSSEEIEAIELGGAGSVVGWGGS